MASVLESKAWDSNLGTSKQPLTQLGLFKNANIPSLSVPLMICKTYFKIFKKGTDSLKLLNYHFIGPKTDNFIAMVT